MSTSRETTTTREVDTLSHEIGVLHCLQPAAFQATLIHELTHAWTREYGIGTGARKTIEGYCEYVAVLFLEDLVRAPGVSEFTQKVANRTRQRMLDSVDAIYGDGLKMVRDEMGGTNRIDWLRNKLRNPS